MWCDADASRGEDADVCDEPLEAVLGEQTDAVAGLDADVHEGGGAGAGVVLVAGPGVIVIQTVLLESESRAGAEPFGLDAVQLGEVACRHEAGPPEWVNELIPRG